MTDQERASISNGIWLCRECARRIDVDESKYPASLLTEWKRLHESWISAGKSTKPDTGFPLIDIELIRVEASPEFAQFEIQFAYDIVLHNKSGTVISSIHINRSIVPERNRQRIAVHQYAQQKLKPFQKTMNVLGVAESRKISREHSTSYEFMRLDVTYNDQYERSFRCTFEGDRDGLRLTKKEILE